MDCPTISEYLEKTEPMPNNKRQSELKKTTKHVKQRDDVNKKGHWFCTMEEEIRSSIERVKAKMVEVKDVPRVQAELFSRAYEERGTDPQVSLDTIDQHRIPLEQVVSSLTKQTAPKELFKIAMPNKAGTVNHDFTEITTTSTGAMEMALNEETIELINNSTKENPNLFVTLKKTLSGHYVMKFNKNECVSSESRKTLVKRTDSGKIFLEINKNIINTIQPGIINSNSVKKLAQNKSSLAIGLTTKTKQHSKQQCLPADKIKTSTDSVIKTLELGIKKIETKGDFGILRYSSKESDNQEDKKDSIGSILYKSQDNLDFTKTIAEMDDFEKIRRSLDKLSKQATEQGRTPKEKSAVCETNENDDSKFSDNISDIKNLSILGEKIHDMLLSNDTALDLTVLDETGAKIDFKGNLTTTYSGHIAFNLKELANHDQMTEQFKDSPVLLENKNSKFLLNVNPERELANATLRKTSSGEVYAVLKDSVLIQSENETTLKSNEISHKVRVNGVKRVQPDPTCLIRTTPSGNYEFVLDKEFGKQHMQMINNIIGDDSESYVNLSKTESGCYLIDFEGNVDNSCGINALLVKSHKGSLKLIVRSSSLEALETEIPTGKSSNVFGELFKKAPQSSRELHREHLAKSKFLESKSCSDSHVYGKVKIHDQKSLLTDPPAILKKTISGQYTVVLNKESKISFINNLKNYISKSGQKLIPIKRTNGGDIIICLNQDHEYKGHYGSLKITPSGNIYVFVEENVLQEIERNAVEETAQTTTSELSAASVHMIGTVVNPRHKAVTTTCNSKRDSAGCDKSKCVCNELVSEMNKWGYNLPEEKSRGMGITWYQVVKSTDYGYKPNNSCLLTESSKSSETESEQCHSDFESPKVGILRCTHPKSGIRQFNNEQCYYVIDTERVASKHKHVNSSNVQVIRPYSHGNWKEAEIKDNDLEEHVAKDAKTNRKNDLSNLDYLESLPPQLPSFLRG